MRYHSIYEALERAFQVDGYEAPAGTPDPSTLEADTHKHGSKSRGELTHMDWVAHHGMTHRLIIDALGGRHTVQYLCLMNRYCYEPVRRSKARAYIEKLVPQRLPRLKRLAVISMWSGQIRGLTYEDIDCGDGTPNGTLARHINEVRNQLDDWHKNAITHLQRVLTDAGHLRDEDAA